MKALKQLLFIVIAAILLMADSFYNGFPIVYSDTSTYIASGLELETPTDRPITYGLFLRAASLNGTSLWFVIFFQSLILAYLIFMLSKHVLGKNYLLPALTITLFLSLLTGVSWTVGQLMPDIFTSIALISMTLILFGKFNKLATIGMYAIFTLAVAAHMSHIVLFGLIIISLFIFKKFILPKGKHPNRNLKLGITFVLTLAAITTMGSAMSKSRHMFFMGAMVDKGIAQAYLNDNCDEKEYRLCAYKDSLDLSFNDFVWEKNSPFYKLGGRKDTKEEFSEIIRATLTQPKYIWMHIVASLKATPQQLIQFGIGDGNGSFMEGTTLYERVNKYFPGNFTTYSNSKQSQSELTLIKPANYVLNIIILLSLVAGIVLFFLYRDTIGQIIPIAILFLYAIILNAWDCATFSMVTDRFGCKLIWLMPFWVVLGGVKVWTSRNNKLGKV